MSTPYQKAVALANSSKNSSKKLSDQQLLQLYAHFKQAEIGPCNTPQPSFLNFKENAKWKAWKELGSMSKDQAQRKYVELVNAWCK